MTLGEFYNKIKSEIENCQRKLLTEDVVYDDESSEEKELAYLDGYIGALACVLNELREVDNGNNNC